MAASRRRLTVRTRVLASLVALAAAGIAVTGVVAAAVLSRGLDQTIDDELRARAESFYELADGGDPSTGAPWASPTELVRAGVQGLAPSATSSAVGFVGTEARFVPAASTHLTLEDDEAFLDAARAAATPVEIVSVRTDVAEYRVITIPVSGSAAQQDAALTVATDRSARRHELAESMGAYAAAALVALVMIAGTAWFIVGRLLRPIRLLDDAAREVGESDLSRRIEIVGNDDLASLTDTVNAMLDRLERAFADQRALLDDAGHELRTPLAVMRTSVDLLEPRDPANVERAQQLLEREIAMMSRLVDDLVVLAKADRPEFIVAAPFPVATLTDAIAARARALADRPWVVESRADVTAVGDEQRLQQAWMQLASNAVKFSEPGSALAIGSAVDGRQLRLWVRDHGRGIAPEDRSRVLERFQRVDDREEGAGLGLPIVAAIAAAHGGSVEIDSEVGVGSCVTIVVPLEREGDSR